MKQASEIRKDARRARMIENLLIVVAFGSFVFTVLAVIVFVVQAVRL